MEIDSWMVAQDEMSEQKLLTLILVKKSTVPEGPTVTERRQFPSSRSRAAKLIDLEVSFLWRLFVGSLSSFLLHCVCFFGLQTFDC